MYTTVSDALSARLTQLIEHLDDDKLEAETITALARWNIALDRAREAKRAARQQGSA